MKKKILSLILCIIMIFSISSIGVIADVFTIEAFAGDVSELEEVLSVVPDEEDWDLYIDTRLLEAYYKAAKNIITWNSIHGYSQSEIDEVTEGLRNAIDFLRFHTQSISISSSELSLEIGKTATLKVTLNPEDAGDPVIWSSGDSAYVSVEKISDLEAEITVNKYTNSKVTITATSNGKSAICIVSISHNVDHKVTSVVTAPTCTERGFTTFSCQCGYSYVDDYVNAKGHSHTSQTTTPATHLTEGVKTYTCACGDSYTEVIAKILEHTFMPSKKTEPTCEKAGYTTYICECGESYDGDYVPEKGHTYSGQMCTSCGKKCSCNCHKTGIANFFWKIANFFNKLFKIKNKQMCACGVSHY